jgi:aminopeptidase YwaD
MFLSGRLDLCKMVLPSLPKNLYFRHTMNKYSYAIYFLMSFVILQGSISTSHAQHTEWSNGLSERLSSHVYFLASDSLQGRSPGSDGKQLATNYIQQHFESFGLQPYKEDSFVQSFWHRHANVNLKLNNVIGLVEGSHPELKKETIVVGAHYDHIGFFPEKLGDHRVYNGADDNASGSAMLLELAHYFGKNPEKTSRSILFIAFDGEEIGLIGSDYFVKNNTHYTIPVMFSLDMVGMLNANKGLILEGLDAIINGKKLAENLALHQKLPIKKISSNMEKRTDTWPFAKAQIPAIHVFTGLKSPYHQTGDIASLLDYDGMENISIFMKELLIQLSQQETVTPSANFSKNKSPTTKKYHLGIIAGMGSSSHLYPDAFYRSGKPTFSATAGFFARFHLHSRITLQPELFYDLNGSFIDEGRFTRHSLTLPVNVQYNIIHEDNLQYRFFLLSGAYSRYNMTGKAGSQPLKPGGEHRSVEWGINTGIGFQIERISLIYHHRRALQTINTRDLKSYAMSNLLTLGYTF